MRITKVKGKKFDTLNEVKAVVEITLDQEFVIKDIRIIQKEDKWIVAMPSKTVIQKDDSGNIEKKAFIDYCHPINEKTRNYFNETILEAYNTSENLINKEYE